jgi:predicted phosphodiesterase
MAIFESQDNMYVAVISDMHLGARPSTDRFGHEDSDFVRFLKQLESCFDRIILLGDVWETLTPDLPGRQALELQRARASHPEIARRLATDRYQYVYGNHDWVAGHLGDAGEEILLEDAGTRILFTHGHQHDWGSAGARFISEWAVWCGGWLLRLGLGTLYRLADRIDLECSRRVSSGPMSPFQQWAFAAASHRKADIIVTGHTHHPDRIEHDGRLFLNSGACNGGRFTFSALDTRRGDYGVYTGI